MVWGISGWPLDSTVVLVVIYLSGCSVYFWEPHSRINGDPGSVWGSLTNVLVVCVHWNHWSVSDGSVVKYIALGCHTDTDYDRAALAWNPCHVIYQIQHKIFWWPDACWAAGHMQQLCWHKQWHLVITGQRLDWCVHQRRGCLPWWHPIKLKLTAYGATGDSWTASVAAWCIWNIIKFYYALTLMSNLLCGTVLRLYCYLYDDMILVCIRFHTLFFSHLTVLWYAYLFGPKWSINYFYYYMYSYHPCLQKMSKWWTAFSSGVWLLK